VGEGVDGGQGYLECRERVEAEGKKWDRFLIR
jgi:hypothetical protein